MPVNSEHPDYKYYIPDWKKCRDAFEGQRAIKKAGEAYLPRLSAQNNEEYDAYKERALFYSITSKSVASLMGMVISKRPIITYPAEMRSYFEDNSGVQFYEIFSSCIAENLLLGRYGLLIDRQIDGGKPQIHGYVAESILNWKLDQNGLPLLVVLKESISKSVENDEFDTTRHIQYRVLRLVGNPSNYVYTVEIYNENNEIIQTITPKNLGKTLDYIPFFVVNPFGIGFDIGKPPMLDIADVNVSHYQTSADLEHGRHFTGLPQPVLIGVDAGTKLKIGSLTAWVIPNHQGDAKYLEFTGLGLISLEKALAEKQSQLASLSARMLDKSGNGSEAADTVRLRYMSETASLTSVARSVEAILNLAYQSIATMEGLDGVQIKLDKEFLSVRMDSSALLKLTESYLSGGMTIESYVFNLRRGDLLPTTTPDEDEIKALTEIKKAIDKTKAANANPLPINTDNK